MRVTCHITSEWFRAVTGDEPPVAGNHPCMPRLRRRAESMLEKAVRTRYRYKRRLRFGFRGYGDTNRGFWFLVFKPQMTPRRRRQPETPEGRRQDTSNHTPNGKLHIQSHIHRWGLHTSERQTDIPKVHPQTHTRAQGGGGNAKTQPHKCTLSCYG